jgi:hypothetical protein
MVSPSLIDQETISPSMIPSPRAGNLNLKDIFLTSLHLSIFDFRRTKADKYNSMGYGIVFVQAFSS